SRTGSMSATAVVAESMLQAVVVVKRPVGLDRDTHPVRLGRLEQTFDDQSEAALYSGLEPIGDATSRTSHFPPSPVVAVFASVGVLVGASIAAIVWWCVTRTARASSASLTCA